MGSELLRCFVASSSREQRTNREQVWQREIPAQDQSLVHAVLFEGELTLLALLPKAGQRDLLFAPSDQALEPGTRADDPTRELPQIYGSRNVGR